MSNILRKAGIGKKELIQGGYSGLAGGVVFGAIIGLLFGLIGAQQSMLPMVAGLVGSSSAIVGFIVNIVVSVIVAISFVVLFGKHITNNTQGATFGLAYGLIWWILGPFILMPLFLTGSFSSIVFSNAVAASKLPSLWAHLVFGVIVGLVYSHMFVNRSEGKSDY